MEVVLVLVGDAAVLRFGARQQGGGGKWRVAVLTFGVRQREVDSGVGWLCHLAFGVGWPCHLAFGARRRVGGEVSVGLNVTELHSTLLHLI